MGRMWRSLLRFVTSSRRKAHDLVEMEVFMINKDHAKRGLTPYAGEKFCFCCNW